MKESGAAMMQKNEKVKNLWKLVTVLGAALIALITAFCFYQQVRQERSVPAKMDFFEEAFVSRLTLPPEACVSIREYERAENPNSAYDVPAFFFSSGRFQAVVNGICEPKNETHWMLDDAISLSDGGLFSYSDWSCESEKTQKELSSAAKAGMKYYSWFVYQTDFVHMTFFVHCNRPKDTEELKQLYSDLATYINQTAKEYDGGI